MVELTKILIDILVSRADTLSGQDIKLITESIALAETIVTSKDLDEVKKQQEEYMKLGREYMFGGE